VGLRRRDQAGEDGRAVEVDRARTALALGTALLRAGQVELVPQPVEQRDAGRSGRAHFSTVDRATDGRGVVVGDGLGRPGGGLGLPPEEDGPGRPAFALAALPQRCQRPGHHDLDLLRPVDRRASHVVDGRDAVGGEAGGIGDRGVVERPADEVRLRRRGAHHGRSDAAESEAGGPHGGRRPLSVQPEHRGQVDDRDGLGPPLTELDEEPSLVVAERRHVDGHQQLPGFEDGRAEPGEEPPDGHRPLAPGRPQP
jgi:hypothetical protein